MAEPVLLVGAGGFAGRRLLEAMACRGEKVIAVSRSPFNIPGCKVELHVREMREPGNFSSFLSRVRAVVYMASASTPGSSAGKPVFELERNLRPILALLEAMQAHPRLPIIYVSSGGALYSHSDDGLQGESGAFHARSYHGAGKLAAEQFIEAWCHQCAGNAIVLRPSNLYGPGQGERPGFGIIPAAFGKIVRNEVLQVWGDGSAKRDYLYIDDFAALVLSALSAHGVSGFNIFNACSGNSVDLNSLFSAVERVTGRVLRRKYDAARTVDIPAVHLLPNRARAVFGWESKIDLMDGLERTWHWFNTSRR